MPLRNEDYFDMNAKKGQLAYLRARGWKDDAKEPRTGGIQRPEKVLLETGTYLLRLFHLKHKMFGEWWSTPQEMRSLLEYFGISASAAAAKRTEGRSLLHTGFVVRKDWGLRKVEGAGVFDPRHLGRLLAVRLREPLHAYHGEGDVAPSGDQQEVLRGVMVSDPAGRQRCVRQVFLPEPWTYRSAFGEFGAFETDTHLEGVLGRYRRAPLYFEG